MFKKLLLVGSVSAQQLILLNQEQTTALLSLQAQLAAVAAPTGEFIPNLPVDDEPIAPYVPPTLTGMQPIEMYSSSLKWANKVVEQSAELDRIMRAADAFISENTQIFAQYGQANLAKAFQQMSQVTVDTKHTLRDLQAFARQVGDRLGDSSEYLGMIQIEEGTAPTADDMEILGMVLDAMKDTLGYTAETTQKVRADFKKVNIDLVTFGTTLKDMIATVSQNLINTQMQQNNIIEAGEAQIAKLTAPGKDEEGKETSNKECGVGFLKKALGKKSDCDKIKENIERAKEALAANKVIQEQFMGSYPMLQAMAGLDKFMAAQEDTFLFESSIVEFLQKNTGSILHTLPEPDNLETDLADIIKKSNEVEEAAKASLKVLDAMFNQTVGRHRFAREVQNLAVMKI